MSGYHFCVNILYDLLPSFVFLIKMLDIFTRIQIHIRVFEFKLLLISLGATLRALNIS